MKITLLLDSHIYTEPKDDTNQNKGYKMQSKLTLIEKPRETEMYVIIKWKKNPQKTPHCLQQFQNIF